MVYTITKTVTLEQGTCPVCGIQYAVDKSVMETKRAENGSFYCPNGHARVFTGETHYDKAVRLERELNEKKSLLSRSQADADFFRKELLEEKEKHGKLKTRVDKGICPHCSRSFKNVKRHIACKHKK